MKTITVEYSKGGSNMVNHRL